MGTESEELRRETASPTDGRASGALDIVESVRFEVG